MKQVASFRTVFGVTMALSVVSLLAEGSATAQEREREPERGREREPERKPEREPERAAPEQAPEREPEKRLEITGLAAEVVRPPKFVIDKGSLYRAPSFAVKVDSLAVVGADPRACVVTEVLIQRFERGEYKPELGAKTQLSGVSCDGFSRVVRVPSIQLFPRGQMYPVVFGLCEGKAGTTQTFVSSQDAWITVVDRSKRVEAKYHTAFSVNVPVECKPLATTPPKPPVAPPKPPVTPTTPPVTPPGPKAQIPEIAAILAGKQFIERTSEDLNNPYFDLIPVNAQIRNPKRLMFEIPADDAKTATLYGYQHVVLKPGHKALAATVKPYVIFNRPIDFAALKAKGYKDVWVDVNNKNCDPTVSFTPESSPVSGPIAEKLQKKFLNKETPACSIRGAVSAFCAQSAWRDSILIQNCLERSSFAFAGASTSRRKRSTSAAT